jgi:response regulator RpfG family c-di-GMP phosphodiesterase
LVERAERVTALVKIAIKQLDLERPWEFEVAARLSQIGYLALPLGLVEADSRGEKLSDEDLCTVASHPLIAWDLLGEVGRLDGVAEMVARQREPVNDPTTAPSPCPPTIASKSAASCCGSAVNWTGSSGAGLA